MRTFACFCALLLSFSFCADAQPTAREQLLDSLLMQIDSSYRNITLRYDSQLEELRQLRTEIIEVKLNIKEWRFVQSRADVPYKVETEKLLEETMPQRMDSLKAISPEMKIRLRPIEQSYVTFKKQCTAVMHALPDYKSYEDPINMFTADPITVHGGDLDISTMQLLEDVQWAIDRIKAAKHKDQELIRRALELYQNTRKH